MWRNLQSPVDLVKFTEEIIKEKLFLCSGWHQMNYGWRNHFLCWLLFPVFSCFCFIYLFICLFFASFFVNCCFLPFCSFSVLIFLLFFLFVFRLIFGFLKRAIWAHYTDDWVNPFALCYFIGNFWCF